MLQKLGKTVPTHIRLPKELNTQLSKKAARLNVTKATLIRQLLKDGVLRL